jgi:hypothetical protein
MPEPGDFDSFVPGGLASMGIEADEIELAVMRAAHDVYWPAIAGFVEVDLAGVEAESGADLSRAPEPA